MSYRRMTGTQAIAIVGVSALFPGSTDNRGFWNDILAGRDLITDVPETHWLVRDYYDPTPMTPDKTYAARGAFLSSVAFDPKEFSIPPSNIPATDTSQLLGLMVARNVLEDAARDSYPSIDRDRISVILGTASATELTVELGSRIQRPVWAKALRESGLPEHQVQEICDRIAGEYVPWKESSFPGLLGNVVAGRIANHFNLGGTNCVVDAACASSLASITMGAMELLSGRSDLVIAGGVDTLNDIFMFMCFSQTPALSQTGDCRPFSDRADGTMLGEGLSMFALRRLEDAERDGDRIYAVLRGFGSSSDGKSKSVYAPVSKGQAKALIRAYEMAGYSPDTVELVEAHGTGTKAGDAAEFAGLVSVFDAGERPDRQWCALGSVKSQIGHTKGAAGSAGLFKAVMALRHRALPPTIKVERPNPSLHIEDSPFYLNTEARPWIRGREHPRRAAVSAFGFGGSNFHVTVEEYNGPGKRAWRLRTAPSELLLLGAATPEALLARCEALREGLTDDADLLTYLARETQEAFDTDLPARMALIADDVEDLGRKLDAAMDGLRRQPEEPMNLPSGLYYALGRSPGKIAVLFPGQGSQYVGMGADLALMFEEAGEIWDQAADLEMDPALKLHEAVFPRPAFTQEARERHRHLLQSTEWAQPAIGAMSLSVWRLLYGAGLRPDLFAGHSFGELSALCAAGVLEPAVMLDAARKRGEWMAAAGAEDRPGAGAAGGGLTGPGGDPKVPRSGAMSAVFGPLERILEILGETGLEVAVANHNGPNQTVVSGPIEAVESLELRLHSEGVGYRRLPVSTAFHSPLVAAAVPPFRAYLDTVSIRGGAGEVLSNADGQPFPDDADGVRERLAAQIAGPVLFAETVDELYARGVRTFIEAGPGAVLTGLVEQILEGREFTAVPTDRKGQHGVRSLWQAFGRLAVAGVRLDLRGCWRDYAPAADPRLRRKPAFTIPLSGINSGRPYPPQGGETALPPTNGSSAAEPSRAAPADGSAKTGRTSEAEPNASIFAAQFPDGALGGTGWTEQETGGLFNQSSNHEIEEASMATSHSPSQQAALLSAIADLQRQTIEAHAAFQRAMADSHIAFLRTAEVSLAGLSGLAAGGAGIPAGSWPTQPAVLQSGMAQSGMGHSEIARQGSALSAVPQVPQPANPPTHAFPQPYPANTMPGMETAPSWQGMPAAPVLPPMPASVSAPPMHPAASEAQRGYPAQSAPPAYSTPQPPAVFAAAPAQPAAFDATEQPAAAGVSNALTARPVHEPAARSRDVRSVMLEVVAEKTGYPVEMLDFETDLESGLGIDSIKRVEILSAVQDKLPGLPDVQPGELAALNTLGEISDYLNRALGGESGTTGKK